MAYKKLSLCLPVLLMITTSTFIAASRHGEKLHFHDTTQLGEPDSDERPENGQRHKNHRSRGRGQQFKPADIEQFEEGIPGLYPIIGPPQAPLILTPHSGQDLVSSKRRFDPPVHNGPPQMPNARMPHQLAAPPAKPPIYNVPAVTLQPPFIRQPVHPPLPNRYAMNPFLAHLPLPSPILPKTTAHQGTINELPISDKPINTMPTHDHSQHTKLLDGNNVLEETETNREGKSSDIEFDDRGLFDTAPHCQTGQILVNNRCRTAV